MGGDQNKNGREAMPAGPQWLVAFNAPSAARIPLASPNLTRVSPATYQDPLPQ